MNLLFCALALMAPARSSERIGKTITRLDLYNDGVKEYCFEEVRLLGRTWVHDKMLSQVEVPMERCRGL